MEKRVKIQTGYTARWVRTVIGRWNAQGEAGIRDRRREIDVSRPLLSPERDRGTGSSFASQASRRRTVEWSKSGPVDAAADRPPSRSSARMGLPAAARSQQPRAPPTACQSR
jgi:hypothetical protein